MKLPSLETLYKEASVTLRRFPFVLLASFLGAALMIYVIDKNYIEEANYLHIYSAVMSCMLGIPLFLSIALHAEANNWNKITSFIVNLAFLLILVGYYISLPDDKSQTDMVRFFLFVITLHLLASIAPYILRTEINGFWHYNEIFFIRILTSALYSGVLFAGLSIAILSFDKLFAMDINQDIYPKLFFFIAGVFNTWFFLAGVPSDLSKLNLSVFYPKGLKLFTQYVLLPLVTVYLLILYLYMGKIILEWNWPIGWVSYLVLGFSITGILSILLIYPIWNTEGNSWIRTFSRWFYLALFPLIVLLFLAILRRIDEYGITENRYFVLILALWLGGIALYFTFSREKNIKIIPATLCILAFLSSFGPWGAFSVSTNSQLNRLEELLTKNNILVEGKVVKAASQPPEEDINSISSVIDYLVEKKEIDEIQPWFNEPVTNDTLSADYETATYVMDKMGIKYSFSYSYEDNISHFNYGTTLIGSYDLRGYDFMYNFSTDSYPERKDSDTLNKETLGSFKIDSAGVTLSLDSMGTMFHILKNNHREITIDIMKIIGERSVPARYDIDPALLTIESESAGLKVKLILKTLHGEKRDGINRIATTSGLIFVKLK